MRTLLVLPLVLSLLTACTTDPFGTDGPGGAAGLRIQVQPLGDIPAAHVDSVVAALREEHNAVVVVADALPLPAHAYTTVRTPRYRADTLIAWLRTIKPDSVDHIIGLTAQDISITKYDALGRIKEPASKYRDFGIFGLGHLDGPACVVSTYRFGDPRKPVFFARLCKVAVHEVGHNRGLDHCADTTCVMRDAVERMATMDAAGRSLCPACAFD